ncbi:MAG: hypothetical protein E7613_03120 [Ruminococcaceae bacterium]|nr:hypothetical protein [Oscillospiraceae bacterium]
MLKIVNIILPLDYTKEMLENEVCQRLRIEKESAKKIILDQRELVKPDMHFKITALCELDGEVEKKCALVLRKKGVSIFEDTNYCVEKAALEKRPVVVGFGPAGIFASLVLAEAGARPIILERGEATDRRIAKVESFAKNAVLDTESNIQFGEGGAGAFSDGKLKVGYKDSRKRKILQEFVSAGASDSILYLEKPHVGSDVLHEVIVNLRKKIISLGAEIHFQAKMTRISVSEEKISGVYYESGDGEHFIDTDNVILAIGHSARDTYEYLYDSGIDMEAKGFGVGVRIEHPQGLIDEIEYGDAEFAKKLGAADYKMVTHLDNQRSLYTFCMCPGGYVVPASSENGGICTNGMSEFARDGENANTALLVSVTPEDFGSSHPLAGIEYQRRIERRAFELAGGKYAAPTIRLEDFLSHMDATAPKSVLPTYRPATVPLSPDLYLPDYVCDTLRRGIKEMCEWKKGYYYPDALLTGPETRTTSPVRIVRDDNSEASVKGIYPAGEGAGYAGGIISSAVDGMMCAEKMLKRKNIK